MEAGGKLALRVAIAGAGPAGLCLASILNRSLPDAAITVYERFSRERDQGAGWDVDAEGRKTLARAGVDLSTISREGSDTMRFYRAHDSANSPPAMMLSLPNFLKRVTGHNDPETNRHAMRDALLEAIGSQQKVHFGVEAASVCTSKDGAIALLDSSGSVLGEADVVVDASGVASPLRRFRYADDFRQHYTGLSMLHGFIQEPGASCDGAFVRRLGQGTLVVVGDRATGEGGLGMYWQRFGVRPEDGRTAFGAFFPRSEMGGLSAELELPSSSAFITPENDPEALARVQAWLKAQMGERWDPMYHQSVDALAGIAVRPLFHFPSTPTPLEKEDSLPLVCIGDALHTLPPWTGEGGNLALKDADDTANVLIRAAVRGERGAALRDSLRSLEAACLERTKDAAVVGDTGKALLNEMYGQEELMSRFSLEPVKNIWLAKGGHLDDEWNLKTRVAHAGMRALHSLNALENFGFKR